MLPTSYAIAQWILLAVVFLSTILESRLEHGAVEID